MNEAEINTTRPFLSVVLCGFLGVLISLPVAITLPPLGGIGVIGLFAIVGGRIGKKHGRSAGFFYFSLVCTVIILTILCYSLMQAGVPK